MFLFLLRFEGNTSKMLQNFEGAFSENLQTRISAVLLFQILLTFWEALNIIIFFNLLWLGWHVMCRIPLIFSSPLGELFDHGLDSSAAFLIPISLFSLFGHGPHSVSLWELYRLMLACLTGFYTAHWEKYNTGTMFLPWTYDASQIVSLVAC